MVINAARRPVRVCCHTCFRTSPSVEGPLELAQEHFQKLGWMWGTDGRVLCPICAARASTAPPPPSSSSSPSSH